MLHQAGIEICFHHLSMLVLFHVPKVIYIASDEIILQHRTLCQQSHISKVCKKHKATKGKFENQSLLHYMLTVTSFHDCLRSWAWQSTHRWLCKRALSITATLQMPTCHVHEVHDTIKFCDWSLTLKLLWRESNTSTQLWAYTKNLLGLSVSLLHLPTWETLRMSLDTLSMLSVLAWAMQYRILEHKSSTIYEQIFWTHAID